MKNNTIPSQWTSVNLYRLGRWDNPVNNGWIFPDGNQDRVNLPSSPINGGSWANFSFNVTAPNSPGTKNLGVQMVQDGREWFGGICSKPINVQPAGTLTPPTIQGINITNGGGVGSAERTSGLSADQGGTGYFNPLTIKLNATVDKNSDNTEINATYYVAFYDKSAGAITSNFLDTITPRLDYNRSSGFLLAYDKTGTRCNGGKYCVYVNKGWVNISGLGSSGYPVVDTSGILYTAYPGNLQNYSAEKTWRLKFDKNFGSKEMYTAAYVFDKNNLSAYTPGGDITPTTQ